jgi:REP element-mobilizing transposase RayT
MTIQYPRRRNSLRYPGYDYAQPGSVFVTVETARGQRLFGAVVDGLVSHSPAGVVAMERWRGIPQHYPMVAIDAFVVMPDHIHGIVMCGVVPDAEAARATVGDVVRWFKTSMSAAYRMGVKKEGWPPYNGQLWHRDYHDRIIRTDAEFVAIQVYIEANPAKWWERHGNDSNEIALPAPPYGRTSA